MSDVEGQGEDPIRALVDRLRQLAKQQAGELDGDISWSQSQNRALTAQDAIYWSAAEALLSLSQERDRLREQVKALGQTKNDLLAENSQLDDLRTEIVSIRERMAENIAAISTMTAENILLANERDRLREALEPFAREAENWDDAAHADSDRPACDVYGSACRNCGDNPDYEAAAFTLGDLRRARAALQKKSP